MASVVRQGLGAQFARNQCDNLQVDRALLKKSMERARGGCFSSSRSIANLISDIYLRSEALCFVAKVQAISGNALMAIPELDSIASMEWADKARITVATQLAEKGIVDHASSVAKDVANHMERINLLNLINSIDGQSVGITEWCDRKDKTASLMISLERSCSKANWQRAFDAVETVADKGEKDLALLELANNLSRQCKYISSLRAISKIATDRIKGYALVTLLCCAEGSSFTRNSTTQDSKGQLAELRGWSLSGQVFSWVSKIADPMVKDLALRKISEFVAEKSHEYAKAENLASQISDEEERGFALGTLARSLAKNRSRAQLASRVVSKIPNESYRKLVARQIKS